jgi:hypothetical protein
MAKKSSSAPRERRRHLNDDQCKDVALLISAEMRDYEPACADYFSKGPHQSGDLLYPFVPVWGSDYDAVVEKVKRLFHPAEAAVIIENLTA